MFVPKDFEQNKQVYEKLSAILKDWQVWGLDKAQMKTNLEAMRQAMKDQISKLPDKSSYSLPTFFGSCNVILANINNAIDVLSTNLAIQNMRSHMQSHQVSDEKQQKVDGVLKAEVASSSSSVSVSTSPTTAMSTTITPVTSMIVTSSSVFSEPEKIPAKKAAVTAALARADASKELEHTSSASASSSV